MPTRSAQVLTFAVLCLLFSGCGGGSFSTSGGDGNNNRITVSVNAYTITYGTALSNSQLTGTATVNSVSVPGTFAFTSVAGTVLDASASAYSESVTFTPSNTTDYSSAASTVSVTVNAATPTVSVNAYSITYGTALSNSQLSGAASSVVNGSSVSVPGTFAFTSAAGTVLGGGASQSESATFTPSNTADYTTATANVSITVNAATPTVAVNPYSITYGTALSNSQLSGAASSVVNGSSVSVPGTFAFTSASGTVLNAGAKQSESVTFTPSNTTDYNTATTTVSVTVNAATPTVSVNAYSITYGTALSNSQLSGVASSVVNGSSVTVPGTFAFTSAAGTMLNAGANQSESVTFTPSNAADYTTATANVSITVNAATTTVTFTFSGVTPSAVLTQIGSSNFTAATVSSNTVTISLPSGTNNFAIAWTCPEDLSSQLPFGDQNAFEATTADGTTFGMACFAAPQTGPTANLTMSVDASAFAASTSSPYLAIQAGNSSYVTTAFGNSGEVVLSGYSVKAPRGSDQVDLLVYGSGPYLLAVKSFSGQAVPGALNGGNTVVFDSSDGAVDEHITYNNAPANYYAPTSFVNVTPAGQNYQYPVLADTATTAYPALPASVAQSGDLYTIQAQSYYFTPPTGQGGSTEQQVSETLNFTGGGPATITFPAPWTYNGPTPAALPTMDFPVYTDFAGQTGVTQVGTLAWAAGSANTFQYQVTATDNYLEGSTSLAFPDLSSFTGFQPLPFSGASVRWNAQIVQSNSGFEQSATANSKEFEVGAFGTYTVP